MKTRLFGVALLTVVLASGSVAQTTNHTVKKPVPQGPAVTLPLSTGTAINASLVGTLDSDKSKPGDVVSAIVNESVVYQRTVLLPKGSRIFGHVVRTGADGEATSALFVEFDRVVLTNGQEAVLNAGIQALAPVSAQPTIPSRQKYEENRIEGEARMNPGYSPSEGLVVPSTYTLPRTTVQQDSSAQRVEGGLDRKGMFTPDSKGAFSEPSLRVFTPMSEGSHGTVLVGNRTSVHLDNGTHLLIVIQPPAASPDVR
jgi:hypothetical protein